MTPLQRRIENSTEEVSKGSERKSQLAGTLSGGEQQMLAMGRGLMGKPTLLILDEPSMGLSPLLVEEIFEIIKTINRQGTTVLWSSRTLTWPCRWLTGLTYWKRGGLF